MNTEQKLWLAKRLPEQIQPIYVDMEGYENDGNIEKFVWKRESNEHPSDWPTVLETEWHHIVSLVEQSLTTRERIKYIGEIYCEVDTSGIPPEAILDDLKILLAAIEQRTTALMQVLGE